MPIRLAPKDPDPYPDFYIHTLDERDAGFQKGSNHDLVRVDLRKIADITVNRDDNMAHIRLLGRVQWHHDIKRWRFAPTGTVGRPPSKRT